MRKKVLFIGPLGKEGKMIGGDCLKNLHLTRQLKKLSVNLRILDTLYYKKSLWRKITLLFTILINRKKTFIISASSLGANKLLRTLSLFKITDAIYWVVGGDLPQLLSCQYFKLDPYAKIRKIIVEGKNMEETLRICGLNNVMTLPNFKFINYIPQKKHPTPGSPAKFIFLSRITEAKGCSYINKAAKALNEKGLADNFHIDYYGTIDKKYKEKFTYELSTLPNVDYQGFLNLLDTANYDRLASYDALLFPTFYHGEGFAGIFIDAFISGLPIIASDWSINGDIVKDGITGCIVRNRNTKELAAKMEEIIKNREKYWQMGLNSQSEWKKYEIDNVVNSALLKELEII